MAPTSRLRGVLALAECDDYYGAGVSTDYRATAVSLDESKKMEDCRASTMQQLKPDKTDVALLYQVSDLCYTEVRREYLLATSIFIDMTL